MTQNEKGRTTGDEEAFGFPIEIINGGKRKNATAMVNVEALALMTYVREIGGGPFTLHDPGGAQLIFACDGVVTDDNGNSSISDIAIKAEPSPADDDVGAWSEIWSNVAKEAKKVLQDKGKPSQGDGENA